MANIYTSKCKTMGAALILGCTCSAVASTPSNSALLKAFGLPDYTNEIGEAIVGAGGAVSLINKKYGEIIRGIGQIILAIDPPEATIYEGSVAIRYNSAILSLDSTGWFGEFAQDPSLPAPPASPDGLLAAGGPYFLQNANASLAASINLSPGQIIVDYDWGPSGIAIATSDHFNFFGAIFSFVDTSRDYRLNLMPRGTGDLGLIEGAQIFRCSLPGSPIVENCGEAPVGDFGFTPVPEPSALMLLSSTILFLLAFWRRIFLAHS